ncbi:MAG: tRNA 2-thiouridine(34) synthase MnmA [bacterium]|nr:tRNA 2-thiouridine(34) synthase MnmA [bacterium]
MARIWNKHKQSNTPLKRKVFVGMSGGVDSSVSAYLLKKEGCDVTGVFIKVWQPDFVPCTWREDRLDAMRVCAHLGIPFVTLDLEKEYKEGVIDYMLAEYKAGRTPNPDVFCNKEVKFGAFLKWALKQGADFVATGHYARVARAAEERGHDADKRRKLALLKGVDEGKDQTYFLWTLTQEQLKYILFPVGNLKKTEVRKIAKGAGLITAEKKDSQGLCFISNVNMKQFLKHFLPEKAGDILNEGGEIIGIHKGALFYTIGERHGLDISKKGLEDKPYYVVGKDISKNTITVSHKPTTNDSRLATYKISQINLVNKSPKLNEKIEAQIRYHGELYPCQIIEHRVFNNLAVQFEKPILISPGQSIVFYDGEVCLGGGIIG